MYMVYKVKDVARIPPDKLWEPIEEVAKEVIRQRYEGKFIPELGYIIAIYDVKVSHLGKIVMGDDASYHEAEFNILAFKPEVQEIIEGIVKDIRSFGAFIRFGPIEGLAHISQILDDTLTYDHKGGYLMGSKTRRILKNNDIVRARIISVSISGTTMRVGLTMRQPFLGKIEWIEEDLKKLKGETAETTGEKR